MKNKRGITLIALVINIIVLLILSGVSILMTIGENGILTQAKNAVTQTNEATKNEEKAFDDIEAEIDYLVASSNDSSIDKDTYIVKKKIHNLITNHEKNASYVSDGEFGIEKEYAVDSSNKSIKIIKREQQNEDVKYYSVIKDNNNPESELVIKDAFKINQRLLSNTNLYTEIGLTWGDWLETPYNENSVLSIYGYNNICEYIPFYDDDGNATGGSTAVLGYYVSSNNIDIYSRTTDIILPNIQYCCVFSNVEQEMDDW